MKENVTVTVGLNERKSMPIAYIIGPVTQEALTSILNHVKIIGQKE